MSSSGHQPPPYQPPASPAAPSSFGQQPGRPGQQPGYAGPRLDVQGTSPIPLTRLVGVELRKAIDTRASLWLVIGIGALIALVEFALLVIALVQELSADVAAFALPAAYTLAFALPILAIMLVTTEWTQRTAMTTFTIEPRRGRVLLAKYLTCVLLTLAAVLVGLAVGLVCTLVCQLVQPDVTTWDLQGGLVAGVFVTQLLATSLGFALGALLLNTPAAIVLFFVYRVLPILVFSILAGLLEWFRDLRPWIDFEAAQGPIYDWSLSGGEEWGHLLVSGLLWLGAPLALGVWRVLRAEVK